MRNIEEGEREEENTHARSRWLLGCTVALRAPEQELNTLRHAAVGVLSLGELRSWVNRSCASPRSALRAISAPRQTERGPVRRPHRCSWISLPDKCYGWVLP